MNRLLASIAIILVAACGRGAHVEEPTEPSPSNEVRVTPKEMHEVAIATEVIQTREIGEPLIAMGRVTFSDAHVAHVFSPVTGRITALPAAVGQSVERGAPLARIASPDVASAVADLQKADADLAAAQRELDRQKELYEGHAAAQRDFEAAEANARKASAERERARQKVALLGAAQGTSDFVLRAPIRGAVLSRNVSIGMEVSGQYSNGGAVELFTVGDLDPIWVIADVFEMDLPRVHIGSPATVSLVAYPDHPFNGSVDWISGSLDPATHTAKVRCVIRNPQEMLRPEMFATVTIETDRRPRLAAPRSAIIRLGDDMIAFVDQGQAANGDERFERRKVGIDETAGGRYVPVLSGLNSGEKVVTSGALILSGESS